MAPKAKKKEKDEKQKPKSALDMPGERVVTSRDSNNTCQADSNRVWRKRFEWKS
jgi:hypothetical protein